MQTRRAMRSGAFQVMAADPAWSFGDKLPGDSRGAEKNYRVLSLDEIKEFSLPPLDDDALLFMWRVSSQQEEALAVVRAWGFIPKSEIVWMKRTKTGKEHFGMGRYVRAAHESCIVATRGRGKDLILDHGVRSTFDAPIGKHSQKPEKFYDIVDQLVGKRVRKVELFARRKRDGWTCLGDQVAL